MIAWNQLSVMVGNKKILHELEGRCETGTITALIGSNGSGKSTLLKALVGLLPLHGTVSCGDDATPLARRVALMMQSPHVPGDMMAWDVIALGRLPWRAPWVRESHDDRRIVAETATLCGVEELLWRPVSSLSGGELARVHLAMTLAQKTNVVLLDEPSAALDPRHATAIFALLRRLAFKGKTIVLSVHDVNLAVRYADAFIALRQGRSVACGAVSEIQGALLEELYDVVFQDYYGKDGELLWCPCGLS